MSVVVCDTGPILHLREAGALNVLAGAADVVIPGAVQDLLTLGFASVYCCCST